MINTFGAFYSRSSVTTVYRAKVSLDLDPLAETFAVLDKTTMGVLATGKTDITEFSFNKKFAEGGNLVLMIFDADGVYNAAILDGINGVLTNVAEL